ncbi:hypothetical protein ACFYWU_33815 [Streptomyces chrestomyceticus]|uniref:hypothetical protein n=1 Tax=Streptomyces chrestomyceticus TaxID=68185 RepID=UPI0036AB7864
MTWLSAHTALTILAVLQEPAAVAGLTRQEEQLLADVAQHLAEWQTNAADVPRSRYGTGWRFRQRTLALTEHPTVLTRLGGPFFLFHCKVTASGNLKDPDDS